MDIGSGAGFPGIPIKIALPKKKLFLVEPQRKKANFLRALVRELKLEETTVIEERAEKLVPEDTGFLDEVVSRAFGSPEVFLTASASLLRPGGLALIMHGPKGPDTFRRFEGKHQALGFNIARLESYELPVGHEKRTLLIFARN